MSRCGSCPIHGVKIAGVYCSGDYGVEECADNLQNLYYAMSNIFEVGDKIWIVRKNKEGVPLGTMRCMVLAQVGNFVIVNSITSEAKSLEETIAHNAKQTLECCSTNLLVFSVSDCYRTEKAAYAAMFNDKTQIIDEELNLLSIEPNLTPPEDVIVGYCAACGDEIYEGESFYQIEEAKVHTNCLEIFAKEYFAGNLKAAAPEEK